MGNSHRIKCPPPCTDIAKIQVDPVEIPELPEVIDESFSNSIYTRNNIIEDSFSDHSSNQQSSDLVIKICMEFTNDYYNMPKKIRMDLEKSEHMLRKQVSDAMLSGILNNHIEISEIPDNSSDSYSC
ncbi:hypothetical protein SteCoe_17858 [Stentor coeruleus]|uniref:Uncharacterized protein n=1 Tax=Stentor coeruleus TaxID=5963 RepID=A0A1R2BY78_9CILI|nr:hypothetical protein SteCoe_17858 [Stentor coeruleus]